MAIPIGLLVNELVTNAYKYAYPDGQTGEIRIVGRCRHGTSYEIEVADSGRGLPEDFDMNRSSTSLGMRVVSQLAKQLKARVEVGSADPGARFSLTFPLS